jgi:glycosyltransferase involved in cell wall biosynthesis
MGQPLVSIIIPHYNRAELLAETLASVEAQDYPSWEVIVVDDGSDPAQWAVVNGYANSRVRILQRTDGLKGPSRCRNLGAAAARGEFLVFLDSDDLLAPWCLAQRVQAAATDAAADLWVFQVLLFRERPGDMDVCWNGLEGDDDLERFLRSDPPWHTSSPLWRREAFERVGGFNERVLYGDDAELHTRALLKGVNVHKYSGCVPDGFIRRGEEQRITNAQLPTLLASRQARLVEGTELLRAFGADRRLFDMWEGQYFVECEELLFNMDHSGPHIAKVLDAWFERCRPSRWRRLTVGAYFRAGSLLLDHAYWALRLARRLMMLASPGDYFPAGRHFQHWRINDEAARELRSRLRANFATHQTAIDCQQAITGIGG